MMTGYQYGAVNKNKRARRGDRIVSHGKEYEVAVILSVDHASVERTKGSKQYLSVHPLRFDRPMKRSQMYIGQDWNFAQ